MLLGMLARDNPHEPAEDDPLDLVRCPEMGMLRLTDVHAGFKGGRVQLGCICFSH